MTPNPTPCPPQEAAREACEERFYSGESRSPPRCSPAGERDTTRQGRVLRLCVWTQRNDGGLRAGRVRWAKSVQRRDGFRTPQASRGQHAAAAGTGTGTGTGVPCCLCRAPPPPLRSLARCAHSERCAARRSGRAGQGRTPPCCDAYPRFPSLPWLFLPFPVLRTPSKSMVLGQRENCSRQGPARSRLGFCLCWCTMKQSWRVFGWFHLSASKHRAIKQKPPRTMP